MLEVGSGSQVPTFRNSTYSNPQVGLTKDLGTRHHHWGQMMCCHVSQYIINNINNINIEIIWDVQFTCLDALDCDTWTNVNLPRGIIN
jgi:hypothetical protein